MISTGRTALVVMPLLLLMLGFRLFGWKGVVRGAASSAATIAAARMDGVAVPARAHRSQHDRSAASIRRRTKSTLDRRPVRAVEEGVRLRRRGAGRSATAPARSRISIVACATGEGVDCDRRQQSAQSDPRRRDPARHARRRGADDHVGRASRAVPRRRADFLDRPRDRAAEHRLVAVQFAPVRLLSRLALRVRLRRASAA